MTYNKEYYEQNREAVLQANRVWREANPERVREAQRRWKAANEGRTYEDTTGYVRYIGFEHPAANESGNTGYHRIVLWDKLGGEDAPCHWCGKQLYWHSEDYHNRLNTDHLNVVKNDNRPENLVPACNLCNITRPGGQDRKPGELVGVDCSLDFCDRPAASRFRDSEEVYCSTHWQQAAVGNGFEPIRPYARAEVVTDTHKHCTGCDEIKPWEEFYIRKGKPKGVCKRCEINRITAARKRRESKGIPCSAEGCEKAAHTKGMCSTHYTREWAANNQEKELNH